MITPCAPAAEAVLILTTLVRSSEPLQLPVHMA